MNNKISKFGLLILTTIFSAESLSLQAEEANFGCDDFEVMFAENTYGIMAKGSNAKTRKSDLVEGSTKLGLFITNNEGELPKQVKDASVKVLKSFQLEKLTEEHGENIFVTEVLAVKIAVKTTETTLAFDPYANHAAKSAEDWIICSGVSMSPVKSKK